MIQFFKSLQFKLFMASGSRVTDPLYEGISTVGPIALSVVGVLSLIYGLFLGVKYAKCEDAAQKANVQKTLINFIIGAVTIWVLILVLYAIRRPLSEWIDD